MLRASSLGLSLPSSNIFAVQQCRRLSGARRMWTQFPSLLIRRSHSMDNSLTPPPQPLFTPDGELEEDPVVPNPTKREEANNLNSVHRPFLREAPPHIEYATKTRPVFSARSATEALRPIIEAEEKHSHMTKPQNRHANGSYTQNVPPFQYVKADAAIEMLQKRAENPDHQPNYPSDGLDPALELEIWINLKTLGVTNSVDEAWDAYLYLVDAIHENPIVQEQLFRHINLGHLHRFCRLLAGHQPKTQRSYLRLLSVMAYINYYGGPLQQFEFTALIDNAGKGLRTVHREDFAHARDVYNDLMRGRLPSVSSTNLSPEYLTLRGVTFKPDVYALTSLASLAARSSDPSAMRIVFNAFEKHDITPNRITYLSQLKYYFDKGDLSGVRMNLRGMRSVNLELGIDGLNHCMSGYSCLGRLDVPIMIYRLLRHNLEPGAWAYGDESEIDNIVARLGEEYIFVEDNVVPDEITYRTLVQVTAYHGHFHLAVEALLDMMSPADESGSAVSEPGLREYRSLFLGFHKHGHPPPVLVGSGWTLANLRQIFKQFLELPPDTRINHFTLHMIMNAFDKCTDHDVKELQLIWRRIHATFDVTPIKPNSNSIIARLKKRLFPGES